ncbi:MAG: DUF488 family protein [Methanomassiliicoccaceae archaeon]|nr:DUF488 family protein [Methanomassiliicoccaceae archaeon]
MSSSLTKNGKSLQTVIPQYICESMALKAGDEIEFVKEGSWIKFKRSETAAKTVFSIGYEGKTVESLIAELKRNCVKLLIDVREIPASRKIGFSGSALEEKLSEVGIEYIHMKKLGSPKEIRDEFKAGGGSSAFFEDYRKYLNTQTDEFRKLEQYVKSKTSVLMCFEKYYQECHRKIIMEKLSKMGYVCMHL